MFTYSDVENNIPMAMTISMSLDPQLLINQMCSDRDPIINKENVISIVNMAI
jgi:hypothetical protein